MTLRIGRFEFSVSIRRVPAAVPTTPPSCAWTAVPPQREVDDREARVQRAAPWLPGGARFAPVVITQDAIGFEQQPAEWTPPRQRLDRPARVHWRGIEIYRG